MKDKPPEPMSEEERFDRLNALGASLVRTRKIAIDGRAASGIERCWIEDEEFYEGIDDLNRHESHNNWHTKPPGQANPQVSSNESTIFVNITRPYVDAAAAKVGDIMLPTDDRPWSLSATPVPELLDMAKGKLPQPVQDGMVESGVPQEVQGQVADIEAEQAAKLIEEAKSKAEKAEKRIEDWMVEGQWHAEVRKGLDDCCKVGSMVLKGPVPMAKKAMMFKDGALVVSLETKPVSKRIDYWNFFPDPACGDSIHNGAFTWERDFITPKTLEALKLDDDYLAPQIDLCLAEGPKKATDARTQTSKHEVDDKDLYEIWYFHGQARREDLEAAGCKCKDDTVSIPAMIAMVNDRVIKARLNPLDTGEFPYDIMPWQRLKNLPWGAGVGRQIRTPQRIVIGGTRTLMTNAGRAAGPIIVRLSSTVSPMDGTNDITPWKQYEMTEGADVTKAFQVYEIPDRQASLMGVIQFGLKMAEDVTGLPLLLQGQAGAAPETLGGQQLVDRNASGVLRRIARTIDDCVTEPHVRRYYAWLLQYGKDEEKGEFVIDARGSTALVERELYKNEVNQLLQASLNPAFGLDPELVMAEHLRVEKKDPKNFQLSEEKKKAMAQQQPQAPDTSLEVAQIRAKTEMDKAGLNQQADMAEIKAKAEDAQKQRDHERAMLSMQLQVKTMEFAEKRGLKLQDVKAQLAKTVMELRVQKEMGGTNVATPKVEPRGKAPEGQAFAR